jgi:hypothetical protein
MFVYFRNGTSVWFQDAKTYDDNPDQLLVQTSRGRTIATIPMGHIAFWCFDNEELTTYGFASNADAAVKP